MREVNEMEGSTVLRWSMGELLLEVESKGNIEAKQFFYVSI